jgi:hypothetical protein
MLPVRFKDIESAKAIIARILQNVAPGCTIHWTVEDYQETA